MVLIDTNILDCLLDAMTHGDFPSTTDEGLRSEQIATFRLFLWGDLGIGRVAVREAQKTPDIEKRKWLQRIIDFQLPEVWVQPEDALHWDSRTKELEAHHKGNLDCRLVAEAELVEGVTTLLSFDKTMVRKLRSHTKLALKYPTEHWQALAIPRGRPPKWTPAASNPLSNATFWRWDDIDR